MNQHRHNCIFWNLVAYSKLNECNVTLNHNITTNSTMLTRQLPPQHNVHNHKKGLVSGTNVRMRIIKRLINYTASDMILSST